MHQHHTGASEPARHNAGRATNDRGRGARRRGVRRAFQGTVVLLVIAPFFAAFAAPAQAIATGPYTVDMANREQVRQLWYSAHEAGNGVADGWTGSIAGCNPGTVSQAYLDATLARINYFRAMAGVPSNVAFTAANNTEAQAAALIMSAQNDLSHDPPNNWACWTQLGHDGAATSNLSLGNTGPDAIDALMRDGDILGHRRNTLNPQNLTMGSGSVPATAGHAAEAQLFGDPATTTQPARDTYVAWPPKGFVPYQTVYPRWSFILRGADFTNATVSMKRGTTSLPVSIQDQTTDFSGPGIVWLANGLTDGQDWPKPANDDPITVTVGNVIVNGQPQTFTYTTTIFDPALADPAHTPLTITGPARPTINVANGYSVNTIPNATGYQWRTTKLSPFSLLDGAESGLANFTAATGTATYNPVSTTFAATGTHSFHLAVGQGDFNRQTLTLNQALVANSGSVVSFKTHAESMDNQHAAVEVSSDGGTNWTPVYTEQSTQDTGFTQRSASLGQFAGKSILLRLRVSYLFDNSGVFGDPAGWYVDDISFGNIQTADAPVLSGVSASTAFSFTPTSLAEYDIEVRAQSPGSGFGDWSNSKVVSTLPTSSLPQALDAAPFTFASSAPAWAGQTATTHDGSDAARSGAIGDSQSTSFSTTVTGVTNLRFWWKSDSEQDFDFLRVTVDGVAPFAGISGNHDWEQKTINLSAGRHTIVWTYSKDTSVAGGQDAAWVDQITTSTK